MFCSSCGTAVVHGLAYCNHCGDKLIAAQTHTAKTPEASPESLVWAIVGVFCVGLGAIIGLMAVMKSHLHFDFGVILFFSMLSFALMTAIESVFIWLLISRSRVRRLQSEKTENRKATRELGAAPARALSERILVLLKMLLANLTRYTRKENSSATPGLQDTLLLGLRLTSAIQSNNLTNSRPEKLNWRSSFQTPWHAWTKAKGHR